MPVKDWDDPATWADQYHLFEMSNGRPTGNMVGYVRSSSIYAALQRRAIALDRTQRWRKNARLLIVGCGYGWTMEALEDLGYTNVWGSDPSTYIQSRKATETRSATQSRVRAEGISIAADRTALKTVAGGSFSGVVTEQVLESLPDSEAISFAGNVADMLSPGGTILHLIEQSGDDPDYNFKQLSQWEVLLGLGHVVRDVIEFR